MPATAYSVCAWRDGSIEIASGRKPRGAIRLFTFRSIRAAAVGTRVVQTRARHAYDGELLLVPGVPEADSEEEALTALIRWARWVETALHARLPERAFTSEVRA